MWIGPRPLSLNATGTRHRRRCPQCSALYYRDHSSNIEWGRSYTCEACRDGAAEAAQDQARTERRSAAVEVEEIVLALLPVGGPKIGPKRPATTAQTRLLANRWSNVGPGAAEAFAAFAGVEPLTVARASKLIDGSDVAIAARRGAL